MNRPPMLMHIKIQNKDRQFGFWLPLFLLFPIALVILIILSPLILIALLILWWCGWGRWVRLSLKALQVAFVSFWAIRGLKVDVQGHNEIVYISII
jgi:hypothetical protein